MSTPAERRSLPWRTRAAMFTRLLAIQGAWNYDTMVGTGIAFSLEPALRTLNGGRESPAYREALARESQYFNAHPYLAGMAVGALTRAELDGQPPAQIERFRSALCAPLGSVGDRLVWAGWLPASALVALLAFGLDAAPLLTVLLFVVLYNVGHLALRAWALRVGLQQGMRVATALGHPVLRQGPGYIARAMNFLAGLALPLAGLRLIARGAPLVPHVHGGMSLAVSWWPVVALAGALVLGIVLVRLHGKIEGWRVALLVLGAVVIYAVAPR